MIGECKAVERLAKNRLQAAVWRELLSRMPITAAMKSLVKVVDCGYTAMDKEGDQQNDDC